MNAERIFVAGAAALALALSVFNLVRTPAAPAAPAVESTAAEQQSASADFGAKVKEYLMAHPEVLFEAADLHQTREAEKLRAKVQDAVAERKDDLANLPGSFYLGKADAPITIVEFFDYHCGYCKAAMPTLLKLVEDNPDVRIRFMEFPILAAESETASRAAIAAAAQGKYVEIHRAFMEAPGTLSEKRILAIAADHGLDVAKLKADMAAKATEDIIAAYRAFAEDVGFDGTPSLIIGNNAMTGWSEPELMKYIEEQRKAG